MKRKSIAVYGAGACARELAWLIQSCSGHEKSYEVLCFIDDNEAHHGRIVNDIPVMGLNEA